MKKGRHRRFEEARAMKRDNRPDSEADYAAWLDDENNRKREEDDDPYAELAAKYNADDDDGLEDDAVNR